MTDAQVIRKGIEEYIGRPASCTYKDKVRGGTIVKVKQGPCRAVGSNGGFTYADSRYGELYIDWHETGDKQPKTFMWARVSDFKLADGLLPTTRLVRPVQFEEVRVFRPRPMRMGE